MLSKLQSRLEKFALVHQRRKELQLDAFLDHQKLREVIDLMKQAVDENQQIEALDGFLCVLSRFGSQRRTGVTDSVVDLQRLMQSIVDLDGETKKLLKLQGLSEPMRNRLIAIIKRIIDIYAYLVMRRAQMDSLSRHQFF